MQVVELAHSSPDTGGVVTIPLTQGYVAIVDSADVPLLSKHKWMVSTGNRKPYAIAAIGYGRKGRKNVYMHRFLLDAKQGEQVDHVNGDGLDNRRANIRIATVAENNYNHFKRRNATSSAYKGVSFDVHYKLKPWMARGQRNGKCVFRKHFATEQEAALAYNEWAQSIPESEFTRINEVVNA